MLFSIILCVTYSSVHVSEAGSSLNVGELTIDDWTLNSITEGNYSDFVLLWEELGVIPSDYLVTETPPSDVKLLIYQHITIDATVYVEIHVYDSEAEAASEYGTQKARSSRPIFERFLYGERIFQEGPLLIFVFSNEEAQQTLIPYNKHGQTHITLVDDFFTKLFQGLTPTLYGFDEDPPSVAFTGRVIWGIRPGDRFTWSSSHDTFTGSLGTGMSHSSGSSSGTWEIVEVSDDAAAILIGEPRSSFKIFNEYFSSIILDTEYSVYTWHTIDDGPLVLETSSLSQAAIFPLYVDGNTVRGFVEGEIEHLPEKSYVDGDLSISGHGRTSSGSGFTPLKTEWRDITIHKGTGVLTSYDFYYNDNEFSITTSRSMELVEANFDLDARFVNLQVLELDAAASNDVERGEALGIQAEVRDLMDSPVDGATVVASMGDATVELSGVGNGRYEGTVETGDLSVGEHDLSVRAEKDGYEPGTTILSFNVHTPALYVSVKLPSDTVRKGRKITLTAEVRDVSDNAVEGATVTSILSGQEMVLSEVGGGEYQIRIDTKEIEEGFYAIDVSAEREGYSAGIAQVSVTVEKPGGIPGFPYASIIIGLMIGILSLRLFVKSRG